MARLQWTPAWSVGLLIVSPTLLLLLLVQLPYSTAAAQRLQMSSSSSSTGAVLDTAARGLTEETVMSHDLKLQQEMQKSTPSLHDDNTNEVSKDAATSGVTKDSASGAAIAAAVEEADMIWDELRVERLLSDYANPSANPDPGVPSGP
ncbi:hypothetical protein CY35_11G090600 [Sphagnum magellanicum]|nr:hypothetical protein CY35_11G090600 [Sphagnum magellanicum]